jgi:hypothetical protein
MSMRFLVPVFRFLERTWEATNTHCPDIPLFLIPPVKNLIYVKLHKVVKCLLLMQMHSILYLCARLHHILSVANIHNSKGNKQDITNCKTHTHMRNVTKIPFILHNSKTFKC